MADKALSAAPSAGTEPEPSYSPSVSEDEVPPESFPRLRRRNETADVDAVAMLLGLSQYEDDGSSAPNPRNNTAPSNRPKRPFPGAKATTSGPLSKSSEMTKKGATRMGPGDNRVRPPKAATKLLPEAKWRHIRLPDVQSALEAEDIVVLWGHYKYPEALPRSKAEGHLNFLWRHYKDSQLKILLEPIQTAFELENFLKDRYGVGTSTKKPRTTATNGGTSNTTTSNPSVPPLPPVQVTAAAINALPPMNGGTSAGVSPGGVNGGNLVEKRRTLSRQPSSFEKQQQQLTSSPSPIPPPPPPRNNATTTENGTINRQSSKEMAGLLYIGAGLTDNNNQEMHTSESPAENGNIGSGEDANANNALNQPRSARIKQEEVEELERKPTAAAAAGPAAVARGQQKQQQQQQQDFNLAAATTAALGAGTKATKATNTIGNNNDNNNNTAAPPPPAAAAATAATASAMLDPATASFLAAAAANGIQMPPGLSFPGMMHPAWGNLLANPLAWQFAGGASSANVGAAGVLPSSNNAEDATNAANAAAISQQMASMFPGLQFPGAFAALGGFHGMPPLHPSTAAAAAAAAAAAGIDPTGLLPGATLPNTTIVTPKTEGKSNASTARDARASNEGTGGKYNTGDRPGRPPSYDIMVRWCVNLKRCLWQRHVPLTIEEAVTMVNDPALCARPPALSEKSRVLVASTLRKRVLGIYKITWSQVATDADPGLHDEVKDASVHAAAGIKLKRHGMEPGRTSGTGGINNNSGSASRPAVVTGGGSGGSGVPGSGMMLPAGLLSSNPSPDEISAFAMASTAATTAVTTTGPAAAATRATRQQNVKKEEPLDLLTTNTSSKDLSQAATVAREAALAAAAATTTQLQGSNLGAALPQLPPMSSSLEDMRNAMGLEIEVKELSPGATAVAAQVPDPSAMKDMLKLMQQQQQGNRTTVAAAAAAAVDNNQINQVNSGGAGGETAVGEAAVNGTEGNFNSIDLPSLASLERAMGSVDGLDIIDAPPAPAVANGGSGEIHAEERKLHLEAFRTKFATVDTTDSDGMFGAMCDLHHVAGITKQECAAICRLWLENVLNDSQKKQLFMYIKANIKEEDLVADWVKSFIRKHGG